jgi:hypothetical protein
MASPFLENLKNAVDKGDFNSEAAKKIKAVDELADTKIDSKEKIDERLKVAGIKIVTEEEAEVINADYEVKMQEIKQKDLVLKQIRILQEIDETIKLSVGDLKDFIQTLEESFDKKNPLHAELFIEIEKMKNIYDPVLIEYKPKTPKTI